MYTNLESARETHPLSKFTLLAGLLLATLTAASADVRAQDRVTINMAGDIAYPDEWGGIEEIDKRKHRLFEQVQPILDTGDLNFANLECPLTIGPFTIKKRFPIRCRPDRIDYLLNAKFNLLSLANNHSLDTGVRGITDTIAHLQKRRDAGAKIWWGGTGVNAQKARALTTFTIPGKKTTVAFFAVANTGTTSKVASIHDKNLPDRIRKASAQYDIVIVSSHYGPEYHHKPWPATVKRYHQFIDAGADMVVAHHPHVVQSFEHYKSGFIFYSLGNFSFGSRTRRHLETGARLYSVIGRATFSGGSLQQVELVPLYANNSARWTQGALTLKPRHASPQLLRGDFARFALDEFEAFSRKLPGGNKTKFQRVGDRSYVVLDGSTLAPKDVAKLTQEQARQYRAVINAGAAPQPATAGERARKTRAGTPLYRPKKTAKPKKRRKRRRRRTNRRKRRR